VTTSSPMSRSLIGPLLLAAAFLALLIALGRALLVEPDPALVAPRAHAASRVVMFATSWCPYCAQARATLALAEVPYVEFDIERDRIARAEYAALGGRVTPLFLIDGELMHGYQEQLLLDRLALAGALPLPAPR